MEEFILKIKELFQKVFHVHKWKIIEQEEVNLYEHSSDKMPYRTYKNYILQCEICGKLKHKRFRL